MAVYGHVIHDENNWPTFLTDAYKLIMIAFIIFMLVLMLLELTHHVSSNR
jgi:large-conductance mechanosensitive channel